MKHVNAGVQRAALGSQKKDANTRVARAEMDLEILRTRGFAAQLAAGHEPPLIHPLTEHFRDSLRRVADPELAEGITAAAESLPQSLGSRLLRVSDAVVGLISGPSMAELLRGTASFECLPIEADDADLERVDVLLVGTPVVTLDDGWGKSEVRTLTEKTLVRARELGVPIAVITLSDPWRVNTTKALAKSADVLLTTDPSGQERYEEAVSEQTRIETIPITFNPLVHSPVGGFQNRLPGAAFSGQLPAKSQPQRLEALRSIFAGLTEADERLSLPLGDTFRGLSPARGTIFPWEFAGALTDGVRADVRPRALRLFDLHVLAHLQPGSPKAHPMETLGCLASGSVAMSTYSVGINNDFPEIVLPDGPEDAALEVQMLRKNPEHLRQKQLDGIRDVFSKYTADRMMRRVLESTGISCSDDRILVAWQASPDNSDVSSWKRQVVTSEIELRRIGADDDLPEGTDVVITLDTRREATYHLVTDIVNGFRMASVNSVIVPLDLENSVFDLVDPSLIDATVVARWIGGGIPENQGALALDRRSMLPNTRRAETIELRRSAALSVIVPVFNNGRYLKGKCFESLMRSSSFPEMEILIVDDGSTDPETVEIVRELGMVHDNVRIHLFPTGGSGSASRPRNHGLTMVRTPWVTYLDPDNEAVGDGYARLLELCKETGVDFAIGDMLRYAKTRTVTTNVGTLASVLELDYQGVATVPDDALTRISFQPMSIQALVARTEWLAGLDIEQPEGALGQDSLFYQQMLHGADRIALLNEPIHTYYGEVAGSMVNSVGPKFFQKYVPLEEVRSTWLRDEGLFDDYVTKRMRKYASVWFIPKFNVGVQPEDKDECFEILSKLCAMYELNLERSEDGQTVEIIN